MSDIVLGRNVNVETLVNGDYIVIGCAVSCAFEFENELIGKTDVNAGLFRKRRVRISDTRGSVQGLTTLQNSTTRLTIFHFLQEAIRRTEQTLRFVFLDEGGFTRYITGIFLVKTVQISSDASAFSEFDLQLEGTGGNIDIGVVIPPGGEESPGESPGEGDICPELFSDYWETVEGESTISGIGVNGRSFADQQVLEVDREGTEHELATGSPGNREYAYDGTTISFDATNPFNAGERIFVIWKAFES